MTGPPVRPVKPALARQGSLRVLPAFGLGSNQWVLVQDPLPVNKKRGHEGPFLFTGGVLGPLRRMLKRGRTANSRPAVRKSDNSEPIGL